MKNFVIGITFCVLLIFTFFMGYGVGISDKEPKEKRELEKQIAIEQLKSLQLDNQLKEMEINK